MKRYESAMVKWRAKVAAAVLAQAVEAAQPSQASATLAKDAEAAERAAWSAAVVAAKKNL